MTDTPVMSTEDRNSLKFAMVSLKKEEYSEEGKPLFEPLEKMFGRKITIEEYDEAWTLVEKATEDAQIPPQASNLPPDLKLTDEERTKIKHAMLSLTEEDFDSNGLPSTEAIDDKTGFFLGHEAIAELWAEVEKDRDGAKRAVIKVAMRGLKPDQFTLAGLPGTDALEDILGYNIPAKERDELWAEVEAEDAAADPEPEGEPYIMIRIPGIRLEQALAIAKAVGVTVGARRVHVLQDKAVSVNIDDSTAEEARAACIVALTHEGFPRVENFVKIKRSHLVR